MFIKISKNKKGFTLAEMIVVMFIFSIISVAIASIFMQFFHGEKKAFAKQKVAADMRYSLELMTREIRMSTIDYRIAGYYTGTVPEPTSVLALLDADDSQTVFGLSGNDCSNNDNCYLYIRRGEGGTNYRITPDDIAVRDLQFYIYPAQDPFTLQAAGTYLADQQPRVLILLEEQSIVQDDNSTLIQTAVSSKLYKR